jgi:hypothetical protein
MLNDLVTPHGIMAGNTTLSFGSELYGFIRSKDPAKYVKKEPYLLGELVRQVRILQSRINTMGNTNQISAENHFVWSNALNTDNVAYSQGDYQRLGLVRYEVDLPDLTTEEGKAKVRAYSLTRRIVDAWANSSSSPQSLAFQMAASELAKSLGLDATDFSGPKKYAKESWAKAQKMFKGQHDVLMALAQSFYEETQKDFKARGVTVVSAARGLDINDRPKWMKEEEGKKGFGQQEIDGTMNPISSWSTDISEAGSFARGPIAIIARWDIPAEKVFCTTFTGLGCLNEYELVSFGTPETLLVRWADVGEFDYGSGWRNYLQGGAEPAARPETPTKQVPAGMLAAGGPVPKVTAGTKLYVKAVGGKYRYYKQTANGTWYRQGMTATKWYKMPQAYVPPSGLKLVNTSKAAAKKVPAKKAKPPAGTVEGPKVMTPSGWKYFGTDYEAEEWADEHPGGIPAKKLAQKAATKKAPAKKQILPYPKKWKPGIYQTGDNIVIDVKPNGTSYSYEGMAQSYDVGQLNPALWKKVV